MPVAEHLTDTQTIARDHLFPSGRERGIYAVVEGGFAAGWFGWGQAAAPHGWSSLLPWAASSLSLLQWLESWSPSAPAAGAPRSATAPSAGDSRSEEHTSELQSLRH